MRAMASHRHHLLMVGLRLLPTFGEGKHWQDRRQKIGGEDQCTHRKQRAGHDVMCISVVWCRHLTVWCLGNMAMTSTAAELPRFPSS